MSSYDNLPEKMAFPDLFLQNDKDFLITDKPNQNKGVSNPYLTNGLAHHYHLDESAFSFRGTRSDFFYSVFLIKFLKVNSIAHDGTPHSAASPLWL